MRHVLKHTIHAIYAVELPFDPAQPETFTARLAEVAEVRKQLESLGCAITKDGGKPVAVKE